MFILLNHRLSSMGTPIDQPCVALGLEYMAIGVRSVALVEFSFFDRRLSLRDLFAAMISVGILYTCTYEFAVGTDFLL